MLTAWSTTPLYVSASDKTQSVQPATQFAAYQFDMMAYSALSSMSDAVEENPGLQGRPGVLTDLELFKLAEQMDPQDFRRVGLALGVPEAALQRYEHDHRVSVWATYHMLCDWLKGVSVATARGSLVEKIRQAQLVNLADCLEMGMNSDGSSPLPDKLLQRCRDDLELHYKMGLCLIQPDPLNYDTLLEFEEIYTNLKLLEEKNTKRRMPLEYENLLKTKVNGILPRRLLVQGEGGAGKTTLCAKIAWDWVNRAAFQQFKLVLVVPLQEAKDRTVGQIVKGYLTDGNPTEAWQIDRYIKTNPDDVFLVFDGFDEYEGDFKSEEEIAAIILSRLFSATRVLVTSRPWRVDEIRGIPGLPKKYAFIEVEGFTVKNQASYIRKFFVDDAVGADDLIEFTRENDVIAENMLPFPIYTAMLCIMWREYDGERRSAMQRLRTFSQLFREMIDFLIDHYRLKHSQSADTSRQDVFDLLEEISEMAFWGLLRRQLVFLDSDVCRCQKAVETACRVGILTREKRFTQRRRRDNASTQSMTSTVQFPHKLFQEYLAGMYLVSLYHSNPSEYNRLMTEEIIPKCREYRIILYFTAAGDKDAGIDIISRLPAETWRGISSDHHFLVEVAFECHDPAAATAVVDTLRDKITELKIDERRSTHSVSAYLYIMGYLHLTKLVLERYCGRTVSRDIAEFVCSSPSLREVRIGGEMHRDFYAVLADQAASSQIEELRLTLNLQDKPSASRDLAKSLCSLRNLTKLDLKDCALHDNFYATSAAMAPSAKVKILRLEDVDLQDSPSASRHLARFICSAPSLMKLDLISCQLHADFFITAAAAVMAPSAQVGDESSTLVSTTQLTELTVDDHSLSSWTSGDANAVFPSLKVTLVIGGEASPPSDQLRLPAVKTLYVMPYSVGKGGSFSYDLMVNLADKIFPRLVRLTISDLRWGNDKVTSVLRSLITHQQLKSVRIRNCGTDARLDSVVDEINAEGRISVAVQHCEPRWEKTYRVLSQSGEDSIGCDGDNGDGDGYGGS